MKQVHKHLELSRTKVVNNILKIWALASDADKYDWYQEAHDFSLAIARASGCTTSQACGIIAALSPMKLWELNKRIALEFALHQTANVHTKVFIDKARRILTASSDEEILNILHGAKLQAFYLNLRYPEKAISLTIDRHALSVALGHWITPEEYTGMTVKQYQFFSDCYRHAAAKLAVNPLYVQSVTWLVWRRVKTSYPLIQKQLW